MVCINMVFIFYLTIGMIFYGFSLLVYHRYILFEIINYYTHHSSIFQETIILSLIHSSTFRLCSHHFWYKRCFSKKCFSKYWYIRGCCDKPLQNQRDGITDANRGYFQLVASHRVPHTNFHPYWIMTLWLASVWIVQVAWMKRDVFIKPYSKKSKLPREFG